MDPRIENLRSTAVFGRRLTRKQIANIEETVACLPQLSRCEPGQTIFEHLCWKTSKGLNRIQLAQRLLEELERLDIVTLPALDRSLRPGPQRLHPRAPNPPCQLDE